MIPFPRTLPGTIPMKPRTFVFLLATVIAAPADAAEFDWTLLAGRWGESTGGQFACGPDAAGHRFVVSPDRKKLVFQLSKPWTNPAGQEVRQITATILDASDHSLMIRYSADLPGMTPGTLEWELRFLGRGAYRWRPAAWEPGRYNVVIGVRCDG